MTQQEIEIIKTSSEFKAADALADAHNSMGFNHEKFAMGGLFTAQNPSTEYNEVFRGNYQTHGFRGLRI